MRHPNGRPSGFLSPRERGTLRAIAEAAIPKGRISPQADGACVDKVDNFFAGSGSAVQAGYRALIAGLEAAAYARHFRAFASLDGEKRLRLLEGWQKGDLARRTALRVLLSPLKLAHFDNAEFYEKLGCVYKQEHPQAPERPRWMAERTMRLADLTADEEVECDVVVVGTGAGGAVVARELAERGHAVIMLEEGEFFTRADFTGRTAEMQRKLYRDGGLTFSFGNTSIPIPVGKTVGGSTTVNSGTCYRVPERVLARWRSEMGLTDFTPETMDGYYKRVEEVLAVTRANPRHLGGAARVIAKGCNALGYRHHHPLLRNAPDCDGKGVCCLGCPTDAKRSTNVSYVPLALRAGAQLFTGAKVERVLAHGGRATGILARAVSGDRRKLTVRAKATVVACGTFYTPGLLERSGLAGSSGQLGKNLSIHPATGMMAWFDQTLAAFNAIPQGYAIEDFHDEGILFEGGTAPLDFGAATLPFVGPRFVEMVESFDHMAMFGFMIEDSSRGRVWSRGDSRPVVTYVMNDADVARMKRGIEILARVFLAAGARRVLPLVFGFDEINSEADLDRFRRMKLRARDFDLTAYHPLGTARMGVDPRSSVVGPSHEVHGVRDLYVSDGSAVPSSLAVNPQLTIMAMATRAAEGIDRRLTS